MICERFSVTGYPRHAPKAIPVFTGVAPDTASATDLSAGIVFTARMIARKREISEEFGALTISASYFVPRAEPVRLTSFRHLAGRWSLRRGGILKGGLLPLLLMSALRQR